MSTSEKLVVNVTKHQGGDLLNVHKFHYDSNYLRVLELTDY